METGIHGESEDCDVRRALIRLGLIGVGCAEWFAVLLLVYRAVFGS